MADLSTNPIFDPRQGSAIIATELDELRLKIIENMYQTHSVASGGTIRSLKVIQEPFSARLISDQKMPFGVMETGRRGGKIPYGFSGIIYEWMQTKGVHGEMEKPYRVYVKSKDAYVDRVKRFLTQEKADRSMAFAIARTIAKSGTKLFRQGGRDTIYSRDIPKTIQTCRERLAAFVFMSAQETIKLNIKSGKIGRK